LRLGIILFDWRKNDTHLFVGRNINTDESNVRRPLAF